VDPSCALDVAEDGPKTLAQVGEILGVTRERVRQIEEMAIAKARLLGLTWVRRSTGER